MNSKWTKQEQCNHCLTTDMYHVTTHLCVTSLSGSMFTNNSTLHFLFPLFSVTTNPLYTFESLNHLIKQTTQNQDCWACVSVKHEKFVSPFMRLPLVWMMVRVGPDSAVPAGLETNIDELHHSFGKEIYTLPWQLWTTISQKAAKVAR